MIQSTIYDFKPIPKVVSPTAHMVRSKWYESGFVEVYRSDAQSYVDNLFKLPAPPTCTNIRLLASDYHYTDSGLYFFRSGIERDGDYPLYSFIQRFGANVHKDIGDGGIREWADLRELDPSTGKYIGGYEEVDSAYIDGDILHFETVKGTVREFPIVDDDQCDRYERARWNPAENTEHFVIECLHHGASIERVQWFVSQYAFSLHCYRPFTRDWKTGRMVPCATYNAIMDLAEEFGICVRAQYGPVRPAPEKWDIYPAYLHKYCANAKSCERRKETAGCTCCEKFLYDWTPVRPEHINDPTKARKMGKACVCEDDECDEEGEE